MFGVTEEGNSVCCHVHGYSPYLYVSLPEKFKPEHCGELKVNLNKAVLNDLRSKDISEPILAVELVYKMNIYGYRNTGKIPFAKITVAIPR